MVRVIPASTFNLKRLILIFFCKSIIQKRKRRKRPCCMVYVSRCINVESDLCRIKWSPCLDCPILNLGRPQCTVDVRVQFYDFINGTHLWMADYLIIHRLIFKLQSQEWTLAFCDCALNGTIRSRQRHVHALLIWRLCSSKNVWSWEVHFESNTLWASNVVPPPPHRACVASHRAAPHTLQSRSLAFNAVHMICIIARFQP